MAIVTAPEPLPRQFDVGVSLEFPAVRLTEVLGSRKAGTPKRLNPPAHGRTHLPDVLYPGLQVVSMVPQRAPCQRYATNVLRDST